MRRLPRPCSLRTASAALTLVLAATTSGAQENLSGVPVIVVTGESVVRRAPDVAYLTLSMESRAANPRDVQRQQAEKTAAVQKALANAGVSKDAVRTFGAWLDQDYDTVNGRRVSRGYVSRSTLEVRVDDALRAGEVADVAVQAGATGLGGVRFDLKDRAAAERDALRLAVENARDRAEAAARGAGRGIDRIIRIEDARIDGGPPRPLVMQARETGGTTYEPGMLEIAGRVTLTASMR